MAAPAQTPHLSVILITHNESRNISGCLRSVAFADEWIVVDSGSSDDTRELALGLGAHVVKTDDWPGFGAQKNRALALARGRWVLSIDADERVSDELATQIRAAIGTQAEEGEVQLATNAAAHGAPRPVGYALSRLSKFCGQWMHHGDWYPDRVLRLFRREAGRFSDDRVHERLLVRGPVAQLSGHLLHETMPSLDHAIDKMNRYSSGRALEQVRAGRRASFAGAFGHALWAFMRGYLFKRGFLDGRLGLVLALYVAEGTYYRHLKIWMLSRAPQHVGAK
jgi:glycosyltransferase involved in cell wall biosynthesis